MLLPIDAEDSITQQRVYGVDGFLAMVSMCFLARKASTSSSVHRILEVMLRLKIKWLSDLFSLIVGHTREIWTV